MTAFNYDPAEPPDYRPNPPADAPTYTYDPPPADGVAEEEEADAGGQPDVSGAPCPVCRLPVKHPDEAGRHRVCAEHVDDRVVAMPCKGCGGATSARHDTDPASVQCGWCKLGYPPPPTAPTVDRRPSRTAADKLDEWTARS